MTHDVAKNHHQNYPLELVEFEFVDRFDIKYGSDAICK